jgi:hypothetical protein
LLICATVVLALDGCSKRSGKINSYLHLMNIKTAGECMFAKVNMFYVEVCLSTPVLLTVSYSSFYR